KVAWPRQTPGAVRTSPSKAMTKVVLPLPDWPISPTISPRPTCRDARFTACRNFPSEPKATEKSRTSSSGASASFTELLPRVQPVAEVIEPQDGHDDGHGREKGDPIQAAEKSEAAALDDVAPGHVRRLGAEL